MVEVSGARFVATFDPDTVNSLSVGADVLIDEELTSIVGKAPPAQRSAQRG